MNIEFDCLYSLRNEKCLIYTKVEGLDLSGEKAKLQKKAADVFPPGSIAIFASNIKR